MTLNELADAYAKRLIRSSEVEEHFKAGLTDAQKAALFIDYGCINRFDFGDDRDLGKMFRIAYIAHDLECEKNPEVHSNRTLKNLGRCYNQYGCSACGFKYTVDSSD